MHMKTLSALAEPNRLNIIELLRDQGAHTVGEIAQKLKLRMPQSSKHLRILTDAGLVKVQAMANKRIYALQQEQFAELDRWVQTFLSVKEEQFDRLEDVLQQRLEARKPRHDQELP